MRCALRSSAAVCACMIDGAWMKPLSSCIANTAPVSPAGVATGACLASGFRFSTQP